MIDKQGGQYYLICDICGEEADEAFDDFYDAVQYKKDNGWKSQKRNGQWEDVCPDCQEG
jgi:hypothetical protein